MREVFKRRKTKLSEAVLTTGGRPAFGKSELC
jgi:hypothetical protein